MINLITAKDFMYTTRGGKEEVLSQKVKKAIINTEKICSDGKNLYLHNSGYFWESLRENTNLRLRQVLFEEAAQAEIDKRIFDKIISDLIVDVRLLIKPDILNNPRFIHFQNGLYDLSSKKFIDKLTPATQKLKFSYIIDADFIEAGETFKQMPIFISFIEKTFNAKPNDIMFDYILENIGYMISSVNNLRKAVVFIGAPASGKSTLANFLSSVVLPKNAVSHVNFQDLGDKFRSFDVACAKLNVGDEMNKGKARNLANFKSLTAGEPIVIERKGRDPVWVNPNVRQLYCTNNLPDFDDGNAMAIFDRLNLLSFRKTVDEKYRDYALPDKLWRERNIILSRAVEKFANILSNNGCFSVPDEIKIIKNRYITQENSVNEFIDAYLDADNKAKGISSAEIFKLYSTFCYSNGLNLKTRSDLREGIFTVFPSVKYKRTRISPTQNVWAFCGLTLKKDEQHEKG